MDELNELKPCPFCGERAKVLRNRSAGGIGRDGYYVQCELCHAEGPFDFGKSGAIEQWNTRPMDDQLRVDAQQLSEALEDMLLLIEEHGDRVMKAHATRTMKALAALAIHENLWAGK
jgi:Lar family restriction alleviation protein